MKNSGFSDWLVQNGGPVIRYLTVARQEGEESLNAFNLQKELLQSGAVQYWMRCLTGTTGFNAIHGSRDTCFENAMGKLTIYGIRKGMGDFDRRCAPYLDWLEKSMKEKKPNVLCVFQQVIVACWLAAGGYLSEQPVRDIVLHRLDAISEFVRNHNFSIYVDKSPFKGVPAAFKRYPLVNPDLYIDGNFALPWIHDIFAFRSLRVYLKDDDVRERIDRVISYVLDKRYQQFHEGYGIVLTENSRYNVMGWDVWLPRYDGLHTSPFQECALLQRLELMSHFRIARSSKWFVENLNRLEGFEGESGRYVLPKNYLREKKNSYFVAGGHMGFGENRRQRIALEIESSYWMLKITRNMIEKN